MMLNGAARFPPFALLNSTANVGDTSIVVNAAVTWIVSAARVSGKQVLQGHPCSRVRAAQHGAQSARCASQLGRYAVHFHFHGDAARASWLRGCSIRNSYSRAVGLHGTNQVVIQNNVAYNIMGHAFFMEVRTYTVRVGDGGVGAHR